MKIGFLVSELGRGIGGHYYSLIKTAEAMASTGKQCLIIGVGPGYSRLLSDSGLCYCHIECNGVNLPAALKSLIKVLRLERVDVIHAFDAYIFSLARIAAHLLGKSLVLTKCGGPNPRYFPVANTLILYTTENAHYFNSKRRYKGSTLHIIPNRATRVSASTKRIAELRIQLSKDVPVMMRIARLAPLHRESIVQAIGLTNRLNADKRRVQLVLIGAPADPAVHEEVLSAIPPGSLLFTDDKYTVNASELLDVADIVIATGRGVMEAASLGKVILTPCTQAGQPVLLNEDNFETAFAANFSPRAELTTQDSSMNEKLIRDIIDQEAFCDYRSQSLAWFAEHFDIRSVIPAYDAVYGSLECYRELRLLDSLFNLLYTVRRFYDKK